MKNFSKIISLILALSMLLALAACGDDTEQEPDSSPEAGNADTADDQSPAVAAGAYTFEMVSIYGDTIKLTLMLKDSGEASILGIYPDNSNVSYTTTWSDNGDGTFTTAATEPELDGANFVAADGTVKWIVDGSAVVPDGYAEPTEFVEKEGTGKDPTNNIEAVGTYVCCRLNQFGSQQLYVLNLNADGSVKIQLYSEKTGLRTFTGNYWGMTEEGILHIGRLQDADNPDTATPYGDWFDAENGYSSDWNIYGNGTAQPAGEEFAELATSFDPASVVPDDILAEMLPENYASAGIYLCGQTNKFGSLQIYALNLNVDGSVRIQMYSEKTGLRTFVGNYWGMNEDGTLHIGRLQDADNPDTATPYGDWFDAENGYSSDWNLYDNGTAQPIGFEESAASADLDTIPAEIYEQMFP